MGQNRWSPLIAGAAIDAPCLPSLQQWGHISPEKGKNSHITIKLDKFTVFVILCSLVELDRATTNTALPGYLTRNTTGEWQGFSCSRGSGKFISRGAMATNKKKIVKPTPSASNSTDRNAGGGCTDTRRVAVTRIQCYEGNPRRGRNPEYDRIKASILVSGLDQTLVITRRPGEENYIVQAGGNTRLEILKELFEASGDEQFHWLDCRFVEWEQESSVLLAHLRENELRGSLTFIDKARAVMAIKSLVAEELHVSNIPLRTVQSFLTDHGYFASHTLISLMAYAVTVLLPILPIALDCGLGKPQVQRIRTLERVGRKVWGLRDAGTDAEFDEIFEALCRRHDSVDWQFEPLRDAVEIEIAEAAEFSIQVIRMEFDCRLAGTEPQIPDFVHEEEVSNVDFPVASRDEPATVSEPERKTRRITGTGPDEDQVASPTEDPPVLDCQAGAKLNSEILFRHIGVQSKARIPIQFLREIAFTLAHRLAERHGIGGLVTPLNDNGLGFLLRNVPPAALVDPLDDDMLAQVSTMWWQLAAFAEMTMAPAELLEATVDDDSPLNRGEQGKAQLPLTDTVLSLDPGSQAHQFWRQLNHEDWCDWLCLAHNYREMHRMARVMQKPLWSPAT